MVAAIAHEAKKFGRYTLVGHIADGGMASVYLARLRGDHRFAKWVALKVVHAKHAGDERFERMFLAEARIVARLDHPNVGQVFDCGTVDGTCYLAMEYLSGQTLQKVFQKARADQAPMPPSIAARIIANAAMALHAAHELRDDAGEPIGVVHRDVSPHNIFVLYSGSTKLMDFGIASSLDRYDEDKTEVGELKGKLAYMSPEQMCRQPIDRRSDIFSLGIVLWEITTGARLFKRNSEGETAIAILSDPIPRPSSIDPAYPPALEAIVMRALAREPDERYANASEMAAELEEFIASTGRATGVPQIEAYLQTLFPSATEEHSTTLRKAARLLQDADASQEMAALEEQEVVITVGTDRPPPRIEPKPAVRIPWFVLAGGALAIAAVGVFVGRSTEEAPSPPPPHVGAFEGGPEPHAQGGPDPEPPRSAPLRAASDEDEQEAPSGDDAVVAPELPDDDDPDPAQGTSRRRFRGARPGAAPGSAASSPTTNTAAAPPRPEGSGAPRPMTEFE